MRLIHVLAVASCLALALRWFSSSAGGISHEVPIAPAISQPVWWYAPFFSESKYGYEAVELFRRTVRGSPERAKSIQWAKKFNLEEVVHTDIRVRDKVLYHLDMELKTLDPTAIIVCYNSPDSWTVPQPPSNDGVVFCPPIAVQDAAYIVGRSLIGPDKLLPFVESCNLMHEVWVPSSYMLEAYRKLGVYRPHLAVVPGVIDTDIVFNPALHTPWELPLGTQVFGGDYGAARRPFVFVSIFNWKEQEGWDVLLRAYLEEFGGDNSSEQEREVVLLILTRAAIFATFTIEGGILLPDEDLMWDIRNWTLNSFPGSQPDFNALPRVYISQEHWLDHKLARLFKAADAFVHPTRGEGYERLVVAAMAMGLPVIATNWGEVAVSLDELTGYPINVEGHAPVPEHLALIEGQLWPQPSVTHLRQLMRHVVENPGDVAQKASAARERVMARNSPGVVAEIVASRLVDIDERLRMGNATAQWRIRQFSAPGNQLELE